MLNLAAPFLNKQIQLVCCEPVQWLALLHATARQDSEVHGMIAGPKPCAAYSRLLGWTAPSRAACPGSRLLIPVRPQQGQKLLQSDLVPPASGACVMLKRGLVFWSLPSGRCRLSGLSEGPSSREPINTTGELF